MLLPLRWTQCSEITPIDFQDGLALSNLLFKHVWINRPPFGQGCIDFRDQEPRALKAAERDDCA